MRIIFYLTLMLLNLCAVSSADIQKCFFESDCPKTSTCVTAKGAKNGECQLKSVSVNDKGLGPSSIISDAGKCTFNTDCPDGGQCIKTPGALYGMCQGSGYTPAKIVADRGTLYKNRSCFFDQDCKIGQRCLKDQGSFKGMCEDDLYKNEEDSKDPRSLLNNHFRTSNKKCLADTDCQFTEKCLQQERSVFGVCMPKGAVIPTTTTPSGSTDPFSTPNSIFNR